MCQNGEKIPIIHHMNCFTVLTILCSSFENVFFDGEMQKVKWIEEKGVYSLMIPLQRTATYHDGLQLPSQTLTLPNFVSALAK